MKRIFITLLALGYLSTSQSQVNKLSSRPNIIYILADDLGYGDIFAYNKDSKIPTPNIDRLASFALHLDIAF